MKHREQCKHVIQINQSVLTLLICESLCDLCDLELDLMTLTLKPEPNIIVTFLYRKHEVSA